MALYLLYELAPDFVHEHLRPISGDWEATRPLLAEVPRPRRKLTLCCSCSSERTNDILLWCLLWFLYLQIQSLSFSLWSSHVWQWTKGFQWIRFLMDTSQMWDVQKMSCEAKLLDPGDPLPPNRRAEFKQAINVRYLLVFSWYGISWM